MRHFQFLTCALLLTSSVGCQSMWGSSRMAGPRATHGRDDPTVDDPWVQNAGNIARNEHPREEVHDPLGLRNIFTSEKAREIERNVGVGD